MSNLTDEGRILDTIRNAAVVSLAEYRAAAERSNRTAITREDTQNAAFGVWALIVVLIVLAVWVFPRR